EAVDLNAAARESGLPRAQIENVGREFARSPRPLAIAGGPAVAHTNGSAVLAAVHALNILVDNSNQPGGMKFIQSSGNRANNVPIPDGDRDLSELTPLFDGERFKVLILHRANPLYSMPRSTGIHEIFDRAGYVVSLNSWMDESTAR